MTGYWSDLVTMPNDHALWLIPLLAFAEACLGIGLFVSGAFLVIAGVTLLGTESATLQQIVALAFIGAVLGDQSGFQVGRILGPRFHQTRLAVRYTVTISRIERLTLRFGIWVVFIGRFVPAIRSLVPAMLGLSGFRPIWFLVLDLAACLLWSLALALILAGSSQITG